MQERVIMWGSITTRVSKAVDMVDSLIEEPANSSANTDSSGTGSTDTSSSKKSSFDKANGRSSNSNNSSSTSNNNKSSTTSSSASGSEKSGGWGLLSTLAGALSEESYTPEHAEKDRNSARAQTQREVKSAKLSSAKSLQDMAVGSDVVGAENKDKDRDRGTQQAAASLALLQEREAELFLARKQLEEQRAADAARHAEATELLKSVRKEAAAQSREQQAKNAALLEELALLQEDFSRKTEEQEEQHSAAVRKAVADAAAAAKTAASARDTKAAPPDADVAADAQAAESSREAEALAAAAAAEVARLEGLLADKNSTIAKAKRGIAQLKAEVQEKADQLLSTQTELQVVEEARQALQDAFSEKSLILADRERALGVASAQLAEAQGMQDTVAALEQQLEEVRSRAAAAAEEEEVDEDASEISRLQEQLAAQNARLVAFEQEGQALAKKQADMEKLVRRTKAEYKGRDTEIAELEKVKSSLEKVVAEQQAALKLKESSASNASKSLSALQAASQASADKLGRMQQELDSVTDELTATKAALAKAQEEAASQQQKLNTVTQEQALLKRQVDASQSEVLETDAQRRDVESREGMLRATNAQLQEGLAHHMADAAAREERLRDELQDMRKRWQDALSTREALAAEMSGASAPLLRQLSQLQETLRTRSDGWQVTESALSERALRAESAREVAEHKYSVTVEAAHVAQAQLVGAQEKIALLQQQYTDAQHTVERVRVAEQQAQAASREATAALSLEAAQLRGLQQSVREMEVSHEAALVKLAATHAQAAAEADAESRGLRQRVQELEEEVKAARLAQEQAGLPVSAAAAAAIRATPATPAATNGATSASASSSSSTLASSSGASPRGLAMDAGFLPSGAESYAANTRSSQLLQQRSEELTSAQARVKQLERARQALLSEVTTLSARNAQLEEDAAGVPALQAALTRARSEAEVLMLLLGEKEEEVEAAQADMREVKALYRGQMETLLGATHSAPVAPEEAS